MQITEAILLFGVGAIASALNAIVGGGSFLTFPVLIFLGIPPIAANATSTVALWPGTLASLWAQRRELLLNTRLLPFFIPLSLLGGAIGSIIVINISNPNFAKIVPWMLLAASILFTWKNQIIKSIHHFPFKTNNGSQIYWLIIAAVQLLISIYGGFFGAGMGIMFMAFLAIIGIANMHEANAVRNCSGACINSIATIVFIVSAKVVWLQMIAMCLGAIFGGFFCANYARKLPSKMVRKAVITVAWLMTIYFFTIY